MNVLLGLVVLACGLLALLQGHGWEAVGFGLLALVLLLVVPACWRDWPRWRR